MDDSFQVLDNDEEQYSSKSYGLAVIISGIFGILGIHHFYLERWGMGIFDLSMSIIGSFKDGQGLVIKN